MRKGNRYNRDCFKTYIGEILMHTNYEKCITFDSKKYLSYYMMIITRKICDVTLSLKKIDGKHIVKEEDIEKALGIILGLKSQLYDNCISEGVKAIEMYSKSENTVKLKNQARRSGIIISPTLILKFLKDFGYTNISVSKKACVFLAAIIEYVIADLLQLAAETCSDNKKIRIKLSDLNLAIETDEELKVLFGYCGIVLTEPNIYLLKNKNLIENVIEKICGDNSFTKSYSDGLRTYIEKYIFDKI